MANGTIIYNTPGAGFAATSATSLTIGAGSQSFVTLTGLAYAAGARVRLSSNANGSNYMEGTITAYAGTSMIVNMDTIGGSGTFSDWNINPAGIPGSTSTFSTNGVNSQAGTTYTFLQTDTGKLVTFSNAASIAGTLPQAGSGGNFASGWWTAVENRGAGTLTITPTTSTIDGAASFVLGTNLGILIFSNGTNYFTLRGYSSQTPWAQNIDAATFNLSNVGTLAVGINIPAAVGHVKSAAFPAFVVESTNAATTAIEVRDGAGTPNKWQFISGCSSATDGIWGLRDGRQNVIRATCDTNGNFGIATGAAAGNVAMDINGSYAVRRGTMTLVNGLNSNIAIGTTNSFYKITGPTITFQLGGFTGGTDGRVIHVYNTVSAVMSIVNQDASSTAANRILTLAGVQVNLRSGTSMATFIYDSAASLWLLVSFN